MLIAHSINKSNSFHVTRVQSISTISFNNQTFIGNIIVIKYTKVQTVALTSRKRLIKHMCGLSDKILLKYELQKKYILITYASNICTIVFIIFFGITFYLLNTCRLIYIYYTD